MCATSGLLHGYAHKLGGSSNLLHARFIDVAEQRLLGVTLNGQTPKFLHPDKETYRYLGIDLSLSMNWEKQFKNVVEMVQQKANTLMTSQVTPEQQLTYLQVSIRPKITYAFPIGIYTYAQIETFDKLLARCGKPAYCLPRFTPTSFLLEERHAAGMGVQSLMVDYVQQIASNLTRCLADEGPLGSSCRDLLEAQHTQASGHHMISMHADQADKVLAKRTHHFNLMRQICILADADIELHGPGIQLPLAGSTLMAAVNAAVPVHGNKRSTSYVKFLVPLLELDCTQLAQVVHIERDLPYLIPASKLAQLFGERVGKRHVEAFNELTRIMTATTRPKGGRKNADIPMSERCLTFAAITELLDGSTPLLQLDDGPSTEGDPVRNHDTRKVLPDLVKRFIHARKQAPIINEPDLTDSARNTLPQDLPHKGPSKQPAISRPKTRSQTTAAAKPPQPILALLNKYRSSCPQKIHSFLHNISAYRKKIKAVSTDPKVVIAALDDDLKIAQIIKEKMARDGTLLYRVQWQDTLLQKRHVPLLEKATLESTLK